MDALIYIVVATFIIAGAYVGYHYSLDPANFEAHDAADAVVKLSAHAVDQAGTHHEAAHGTDKYYSWPPAIAARIA